MNLSSTPFLQHLRLLLLWIGFVTQFQSTVHGDSVVYEAGRNGGHVVLNGQILEFTRKTLAIRVASPDIIKELPAERILAFRVDQQLYYQQAKLSVKRGEILSARQKLELALQSEPHPWMKREILAEYIAIDLIQNDWRSAAKHFLAMLESSSETRHLELVPLHWREEELTAETQLWALSNLNSTGDYQKLIAASWLLGSPKHMKQAKKVMQTLLANPRPEVRNAARSQLWRTEFLEKQIREGDVQRWERQLIDLPDDFRAGPMFLLGQGYERLIQKELASARYLWLTTIDSRNQPLAREATLRAAKLLMEMGQQSQSKQLLSEAERRFPVFSVDN